MTEVCPHCQSDLRGAPIPDRPGQHYSRAIGAEVLGVYDGMLYFQCPDCDQRWHRFPEGNPLRAKAVPFVGCDLCSEVAPRNEDDSPKYPTHYGSKVGLCAWCAREAISL